MPSAPRSGLGGDRSLTHDVQTSGPTPPPGQGSWDDPCPALEDNVRSSTGRRSKRHPTHRRQSWDLRWSLPPVSLHTGPRRTWQACGGPRGSGPQARWGWRPARARTGWPAGSLSSSCSAASPRWGAAQRWSCPCWGWWGSCHRCWLRTVSSQGAAALRSPTSTWELTATPSGSCPKPQGHPAPCINGALGRLGSPSQGPGLRAAALGRHCGQMALQRRDQSLSPQRPWGCRFQRSSKDAVWSAPTPGWARLLRLSKAEPRPQGSRGGPPVPQAELPSGASDVHVRTQLPRGRCEQGFECGPVTVPWSLTGAQVGPPSHPPLAGAPRCSPPSRQMPRGRKSYLGSQSWGHWACWGCGRPPWWPGAPPKPI